MYDNIVYLTHIETCAWHIVSTQMLAVLICSQLLSDICSTVCDSKNGQLYCPLVG